MDFDDLVSSVLDAVAEDSTQPDTLTGKIVWVSSPNVEIQNILTGLFEELQIEDKVAGMIREVAKFGDLFERVWYKSHEGVIGIEYYPPHRVFRWEDQGRLRGFLIDHPYQQGVPLEELYAPWDFVHFYRSTGRFSEFVTYGDSWVRPARRLWRKLQMIEDSIIMYRLKMAPDRFVYYIDVGESSFDEAMHFLMLWRSALKKQMLYKQGASSDYREEYNPLAVDDDLFFPTREGSQSRVDKLVGSGNTVGDVHDYELLIKRLFSALRAPPAYFGFKEEGVVIDTGKSIAQQDIRWARGCRSVQKSVTRGLVRLCQIHLALKGIDPTLDKNRFSVEMAPISFLDEQQRLEIYDVRSRAIDVLMRVVSDIEGLNKKRWASWLLWRFGGLSQDFLDEFVESSAGQDLTGFVGEPLTKEEESVLQECLGKRFLQYVSCRSRNIGSGYSSLFVKDDLPISSVGGDGDGRA